MLDSMLHRLGDIVRARVPDVIAIYAFGSRARGDALEGSDYDLAVLARTPLQPVERWKIQEDVAAVARANVDLVDLRRASTVLCIQVLKDGIVLVDAAPSERELFEASTLSAYARLNEERRGILADISERGRIS
jgi:predicted nucleotidyltransferase